MNKLTLIRSIPGGGKTTLALKLAREKGGVCVAADDFFTDAIGEYHWNPSFVGTAHKYCIGVTFYHLFRDFDVFVHNTFTTWKEIEPYAEAAKAGGFELEIIEPSTEWRYDVNECFKRNSHRVPLEAIQRMRDRWESTESIVAKLGAV